MKENTVQDIGFDVQEDLDMEFAAMTKYPTSMKLDRVHMNDEEKIDTIAQRFQEIMETLGLDLSDPSLAETPRRVAKMYVNEIFSGLRLDNYPRISMVEDRYQNNETRSIVFMKVGFTSFCEHHFVPMIGNAYVAYIPNNKLIGLSKIPRIVRYFARRPQLQERLNAQIADSLAYILDTDNVAVSLVAEHYCILSRGVEKEATQTITNVLRGDFERDRNRRKEFFDSIKRVS